MTLEQRTTIEIHEPISFKVERWEHDGTTGLRVIFSDGQTMLCFYEDAMASAWAMAAAITKVTEGKAAAVLTDVVLPDARQRWRDEPYKGRVAAASPTGRQPVTTTREGGDPDAEG